MRFPRQEVHLDVMNVEKIPVGDPVVDRWVKRLHFVSIVAHLQSAPFAPGWLGLSPLLWDGLTPDGGGEVSTPTLPPSAGFDSLRSPLTGLPSGESISAALRFSGSSAFLSLRAVSSHPGEPVGCVQGSLHRQWQASPSLEDWPLPYSVTRPNRVHFHYGSQVRLGDCSFQRRFGYMLDTYLTC